MKLLLGDCLEVMKSIPDQSVDLCLTDPPYGTIACEWDTVINFEPMWKELHRIVKINGAICLFGSEPFSSYLRMSNIKEFKYDWIWKKNHASGAFLAKKMPMKTHEIISVFYISQPIYNRQFIEREEKAKKRYISNLKNHSIEKNMFLRTTAHMRNIKHNPIDPFKSNPKSVLFFDGVARNSKKEKSVHPTQKPVALLEYLIKTYTLECETVLDFTMGSGSTGVACKNLNRQFIGIEKDEKYFEIAKKRIENA